MDLESDLFRYGQYSNLEGHRQTVQVGRRNRQIAPFFIPEESFGVCLETPGELSHTTVLLDQVSVHLTPTELRTWHKLLNGQSIAEIAREEGVSRTAIYERIRGKSNGHGGMTAKNPFVWLYWDRRKRSKQRP